MRVLALHTVCMAASLVLASSGIADMGKRPATDRGAAARTNAGEARPLQIGDSIRDILNHPAFAGFARLILPWDDRTYDENLRLREIGTLLPYHSDVVPDEVVGALNRMIDESGKGRRVFYDIYTQAERQADPTKERAGLFFFRGRPGAPFAIIAPGGGFAYVGSVHEGFPYAAAISEKGYNAFVLRYRPGQGARIPTQDLAAAIAYVFANAAELSVGLEDYALWGSSAGARMAAFIGSHGPAAFGGGDLPRPAAVVMAYTAHSDRSDTEPPTFAVVGEKDGIAPPSAMERRLASLRGDGVRVEYRKFPGVAHGFGLGTGTSAEGWIDGAVAFWAGSMKPAR